MFNILPQALASVASFLFPVFASYKALNSSDPAQLTPWLMYWVVLSCVVLVESWTGWLLVWVPFYYYLRLGFLLYLVLPQTQGARVLYQTHLHPFLTEHEADIDELIGSAHARLRSAGQYYLKRAIAQLKQALGMPADPPSPPPSSPTSRYSLSAAASASASSYTQSLLARFTLPSARWPGGAAGAQSGTGTGAASASGTDLYGMLASAVGAFGSATTGAAGAAGAVGAAAAGASALSRGFMGTNSTGTGTSGASPSDRASFLATQRDRLRVLLSALEKEAADLEAEQGPNSSSSTTDEGSTLSRPLSGASGLSKSRSEADFEKIDAESGTEEDTPAASMMSASTRRRNPPSASTTTTAGSGAGAGAGAGAGKRTSSGSWIPWWGSSEAAAVAAAAEAEARSSSVDK